MAENIRKFEQDLQGNEELRKKYEAEIKRIAEAGEAQSDAEAVVKAAKALGYDIGISDIEKTMAESAELDQDELETVTGGELMNWCLYDWSCFDVFKHNLDGKDREDACFKDYHCSLIYPKGFFSKSNTGPK